jgi:hypothetical protein
LAKLTALVLIGRARLAARILQGAQNQPAFTSAQLRAKLHSRLFPTTEPMLYQRDGLLFEIICWIVAELTAEPDEVVSEPHLTSTQQGLDAIKITFDVTERTIARAIVYEQKCTENARQLFLSQVLPAFRKWMSGERDNELLQAAVGLMQRFNLTDEELIKAYDHLAQDRPLAFCAALTVTPSPFETPQCVALFADFSGLTPLIDDRMGDTFPLVDIRAWFELFAQKVWQKIETSDV